MLRRITLDAIHAEIGDGAKPGYAIMTGVEEFSGQPLRRGTL